MWQDAMTSEKAMLKRCVCAVIGVAMLTLVGCSNEPKMDQPSVLDSPYPAAKLWAVAPINNESGTTLVDTVVLADKVTQSLHEVRGINIVPVNRVLAAMQKLELGGVNSVADARRLMLALGTDGLIVGTLTAWDPYEPPKIGMTIQLIARQVEAVGGQVDPRQMTAAATGNTPGHVATYRQPVAQASGYYDAANHETLADVHTYAVGRTPLESPSGWRRYLLSMDLYSEFVSYQLTRQLLEHEWHRLRATPAGSTDNAN